MRQIGRQGNHFVDGLALQCIEQLLLDFARQASGTRQTAIDADVPEVHVHVWHISQLQHSQHQTDDLDITARACVAVQLGTELNRAARRRQRARLGVQDAARIAQTTRAFTFERVGIDACNLRRDVGAKAHLPARLRIDNLEGAQIQIRTRSCQQGLQILDMRGDDKLIAPALKQIQHLTTRYFNARRFRWQYFFDAIW